MATEVRYPDNLPCPLSAPMSPTNRVLSSDVAGATQYRGFQRDFHGSQQVEFILDKSEAQQFDIWWRDELLRGGLWFAANWPLPSGHINNVYRFLAPPAWQFLGLGRWRVRAELEIRGRGVLPKNYDVVVITSRPYPVESNDSMALAFDVEGGARYVWPQDSMPFGFALVSAAIRSQLQQLALEPEEMSFGFGLVSADLQSVLVELDMEPEGMSFDMDVVSVELKLTLITYEEWPEEEISMSFGLVSGSLV